MRRYVLTVLLAGALVPAGGAATNGPNAMSVDAAQANFLGEYGRVWQSLHPRYQRVTTRAFWESCRRARAAQRPQGLGLEVESARVVESNPETITRPLLGRIHVTAVTVLMRYTTSTMAGSDTQTATVYWTKVRGEWKGLWEPAEYRAYSRHRCPA